MNAFRLIASLIRRTVSVTTYCPFLPYRNATTAESSSGRVAMTTNVPVENRLMVMDAASAQNERTLIELPVDQHKAMQCTLFKSTFRET